MAPNGTWRQTTLICHVWLRQMETSIEEVNHWNVVGVSEPYRCQLAVWNLTAEHWPGGSEGYLAAQLAKRPKALWSIKSKMTPLAQRQLVCWSKCTAVLLYVSFQSSFCYRACCQKLMYYFCMSQQCVYWNSCYWITSYIAAGGTVHRQVVSIWNSDI